MTEEKFEETLASIKEIYVSLTEKEPTPDEEIEAREKLIILFNNLMGNLSNPEQKDLIEEISSKLEEWDTLEYWFTETKIPEDIKLLLNFPDVINEDKPSGSPQLNDILLKDSQPSNLDVNDIVSEVSQRFKGEIDSLKNTIDGLKKELDKKSETIHKKKVKKIVPKKTSKLAPPVIKIPVIKKVVPPSKNQIEKSIPPVLPKEEIKPSVIEEVKIAPKKVKVNDLTPIPTKPDEMGTTDDKDLTPIPINEVKKKPSISTTVIEENKDELIIMEKRKITPIVSEISSESEPEIIEKTEEKPIMPFSVEPPKIRNMSIEEVETETIKTSGNDLFNVLSNVGEKQQIIPKGKSKEKVKEKEHPKIPEKKEEPKSIEVKETQESKQPTISSFVDFDKDDTEELPTEKEDTEAFPVDKDALYQELIALEGKRYAVEKGYKELEASYNKGTIADMQYKQKNDEIQSNMQQITARITTIRRLISSL